MRKLSEIKNGDALDVLADIMDPVVRICQDTKIKELAWKKDKIGAVQVAIKNHKKDVLHILAILDGEDPDVYEVNIVQIPIKVFDLLNDPDMAAFFESQGLMTSGKSSGSATENIEAIENQ